MKTLIAAGLAASALMATTAASAKPVYPVDYHHRVHHAVVLRGPIAYRHEFWIAPIHARAVVYREGYIRPGFYTTAYPVRGYRFGYHHAFHHAYVWRHGPIRHHIAWRGAYAGEHRPV